MSGDRIQLKRSSFPGRQPHPTELLPGELALNREDLAVYTLDASGNVVAIVDQDPGTLGGLTDVDLKPPLSPYQSLVWDMFNQRWTNYGLQVSTLYDTAVIDTAVGGDVLTYDAAQQKWVPGRGVGSPGPYCQQLVWTTLGGRNVISGLDDTGKLLTIEKEGQVLVSVNGVMLTEGLDYTVDTVAERITLTEAVFIDGDQVQVVLFQPTNLAEGGVSNLIGTDGVSVTSGTTFSSVGNALTVISLEFANPTDVTDGIPRKVVDAAVLHEALGFIKRDVKAPDVFFDTIDTPTEVIDINSGNVDAALRDLDKELSRLTSAQIFAGTYDANLNKVITASASGSSAVPQFKDGQDIPAAEESIRGMYVYVAIAGEYQGQSVSEGDTINCDGVKWIVFPAAIPPAPVQSVFGRVGQVVASKSDYDAIQVDYDNQASNLTATDVQAAIDELTFGANVVSSVHGRVGDVVSEAGDYTASQVDYVDNVTALGVANVQDAIVEVWRDANRIQSVHGRVGFVTAQPGDYSASLVLFDNSNSVLNSTNTQDAIDELSLLAGVTSVHGRTGDVVSEAGDYNASQVTFDNTTSVLNSTNTQDAIDELTLRTGVTSVHGRAGDVVSADGDYNASQVTYDNTTSVLNAATTQGAIDELTLRSGVTSVHGRDGDVTAEAGDYNASLITYSNLTSGLNATTAQEAIDELVSGTVTSVHGRVGDVVSSAGDYNASQITFDTTGAQIISPTSTDVDLAVRDLDAVVNRLDSSQVLAGTFDVANLAMDRVTSAGAAATPQFILGQTLPTPAPTISAHFVFASTDGQWGGQNVSTGQRIWCDGTAWIPVPDPAGSLEARIAALEARRQIQGTWQYGVYNGLSGGFATSQGNIGELAVFTNAQANGWGTHGIAISGNQIQILLPGVYYITLTISITNHSGGGGSTNRPVSLEVPGLGYLCAPAWTYGLNQGEVSPQTWTLSVNSPGSSYIRLNGYGGATFDYSCPIISVIRMQ